MIEFDFELNVPFDYAHKGEQFQSSFIKLIAPSAKHARFCAPLKQAIFRSLPNDAGGKEEVDEKEKSQKLEGQTLMALIYQSETVELSQVLLWARELFISKPAIALVEGVERVTNPIIDVMHPDDFEEMIGEYIANFVVASIWSKLNKD